MVFRQIVSDVFSGDRRTVVMLYKSRFPYKVNKII
jgi:hypothetical protein